MVETDAAGVVLSRSRYAPFGARLGSSGDDGPGYTGHVEDSVTGLVYAQQRYYDPVIGRFLSPDPVLADAGNGGNFNRYWYANNNPYRFTDPDGRIDFEKIRDAFKVEFSLGFTAGPRIKIGRIKAEAAIGGASGGFGVTAAPDLYGFQVVEGPSFQLTYGGQYGIGIYGESQTDYQGRGADGSWRSDKSVGSGGFRVGRMTVDGDGDGPEISVSVGFIARAKVSIDLKQIKTGIHSNSGKVASENGSSAIGAVRVDSRTDSNNLALPKRRDE